MCKRGFSIGKKSTFRFGCCCVIFVQSFVGLVLMLTSRIITSVKKIKQNFSSLYRVYSLWAWILLLLFFFFMWSFWSQLSRARKNVEIRAATPELNLQCYRWYLVFFRRIDVIYIFIIIVNELWYAPRNQMPNSFKYEITKSI